MAKAKYLLMLCEPVDGETAEKYGLVSLCVPDDELQDKAIDVAKRLAAGAPSAIRWTTYALNNWYRMMGPAFDASTALEMLGFAGSEVREGLASHLEKRKPVFDPNSPV
jgi:enoyl-CoA hydratase